MFAAVPADVLRRSGRRRRFERGEVVFHRDDPGDSLHRIESGRLAARIVTRVVDPGVRERGIGKRLMADAERVARDDGAAFLEVTAGHHRPEARKLFESLGYDAGLAAYLPKRP